MRLEAQKNQEIERRNGIRIQYGTLIFEFDPTPAKEYEAFL